MTTILSKWNIDYHDYWLDVKGCGCEKITEYLLDQFRWCWRDMYVANTQFETDIVECSEGSLIYQFDTQVVEEGDLCMKAGRLVAVYGRVGKIAGLEFPSAKLRQRFMGPTEKWIGPVDKGHFIAHSLGGSSNMNIFPQVRELNRGWSEEGKKFREMERLASQHPGMMLFNRPIYSDGTVWPRYFEFGLLKPDGELWIELFDNERPPGAFI